MANETHGELHNISIDKRLPIKLEKCMQGKEIIIGEEKGIIGKKIIAKTSAI